MKVVNEVLEKMKGKDKVNDILTGKGALAWSWKPPLRRMF